MRPMRCGEYPCLANPFKAVARCADPMLEAAGCCPTCSVRPRGIFFVPGLAAINPRLRPLPSFASWNQAPEL